MLPRINLVHVLSECPTYFADANAEEWVSEDELKRYDLSQHWLGARSEVRFFWGRLQAKKRYLAHVPLTVHVLVRLVSSKLGTSSEKSQVCFFFGCWSTSDEAKMDNALTRLFFGLGRTIRARRSLSLTLEKRFGLNDKVLFLFVWWTIISPQKANYICLFARPSFARRRRSATQAGWRAANRSLRCVSHELQGGQSFPWPFLYLQQRIIR